MVLAGRFLRNADLGALDYAALRHEGSVWGSRAAATVILANDRLGPAFGDWPAWLDLPPLKSPATTDVGR